MSFSRRGVLKLCAFAANAPLGCRANQIAGPQPGDALVAVTAPSATPLPASAVQRGAPPMLVWPMELATKSVGDTTRLNQILLLRVAGKWDGEPDRLVAFSAICPHAGCLVSGWIAATGWLLCPCHGSEYDPGQDGKVMAGPAPQPLPMLPVTTANGLIIVAGPFSAPPGGHTSRTM